MRTKKLLEKDSKKGKSIKRITVTGLFGMFNHTIPLNLDERLTIMHGPNGFGKTVMLKLVTALFNRTLSFLYTTPFTELRVDFDDNTSLWVTKSPQQLSLIAEEEPSLQQVTFHTTGKASFSAILKTPLSQYTRSERQPAQLELPDAEHWQHSTGELFSLVAEQAPYEVRPPLDTLPEKEPEWLLDLRNAVAIYLIETQRLLLVQQRRRPEYGEPERPQFVPTVTLYAKELAEIIKTKLADAASLSHALDRTFLERVFNPTTTLTTIHENELCTKLIEIEKKRSRLMSLGLLDQVNSSTFRLRDRLDESHKILLAVYIEDAQRKLSIFNDLAKKIDLLKAIINNRFLYKKMSIDKDYGFIFTSSNGTTLQLEHLSLGEQHELVLFYELLFKVASGSLILLDEPEISLHILWQEQFLRDVQAVIRVTNTDLLLVTHSPDIIADRRDLVVELEGPDNVRLL